MIFKQQYTNKDDFYSEKILKQLKSLYVQAWAIVGIIGIHNPYEYLSYTLWYLWISPMNFHFLNNLQETPEQNRKT